MQTLNGWTRHLFYAMDTNSDTGDPRVVPLVEVMLVIAELDRPHRDEGITMLYTNVCFMVVPEDLRQLANDLIAWAEQIEANAPVPKPKKE